LASPDADADKRTFPGASANARFEVITATMTVLMLLSLKAFA
jgi:hypothetical protein